MMHPDARCKRYTCTTIRIVCSDFQAKLSSGFQKNYIFCVQRGSVQPAGRARVHLGGSAVPENGVPPYDFLNLYGIFNSRFCVSFS